MQRPPKALLISVISLTLLFLYIRAGHSRPTSSEELALGSVDVDHNFLLFFRPTTDEEPSKEVEKELQELCQRYVSVIEHALDGDVVQQYDTVFNGLAFGLGYTEKVMRVLGSPQIPQNVSETTTERLYEFLSKFVESDLKSLKYELILERDSEVSTQADF